MNFSKKKYGNQKYGFKDISFKENCPTHEQKKIFLTYRSGDGDTKTLSLHQLHVTVVNFSLIFIESTSSFLQTLANWSTFVRIYPLMIEFAAIFESPIMASPFGTTERTKASIVR